jgi:hypothetical protein
MSDTRPASNRNQTLTGLLWGAFAILAAIGAFEDPRAVRIISWSLALLVAFVLVGLERRSGTEPGFAPRPDPKVEADRT